MEALQVDLKAKLQSDSILIDSAEKGLTLRCCGKKVSSLRQLNSGTFFPCALIQTFFSRILIIRVGMPLPPELKH